MTTTESTTPFELLGDMEEDLCSICDFARALTGVGEALGRDYGSAVSRVAWTIHELGEEAKAKRTEAWHLLHPRRDEPDFPPDDDGNGEAKESADDAGLIALGQRLTIAYAAEQAAFARDCSHEEGDMLHKACSKIVRQIEKVPATTLAGLRVKAAAIDWCCGGKPFADADDTTDKRLVTSLLTDLEAMQAGA